MAVVSTIIAGIGLAVAAGGAAVSYTGQKKVAKAQKKQERIRGIQMNLDAMRRRRELIRDLMVKRALGVSNAVGQGASVSDSSVQGGLAQATQTANVSGTDSNQNLQLGTDMFSANAQEAQGRGVAAFGGAVGSWGSGLVENSKLISRVGAGVGLGDGS